MVGGKENFEEKLSRLSKDYQKQLPNRVLKVIEHWRTAHAAKEPLAEMEATYREIHSISGSGATFGFPQVSLLAKKIEQMVQQAIQDQAILPVTFQSVNRGLEHLHKIVLTLQSEEIALPLVQEVPEPRPVPEGRDLVFWLGSQANRRENWITQLEKFYLQIRFFTEVQTLAELLGRQTIQALIVELDPKWLHGDELERVFAQFAKRGAHVPLIVLLPANPVPELIFRCFRAGADSWMDLPPDWVRLVRQIDANKQNSHEVGYRLLLIDDDQALVEHTAEIMRKAGMTVETVVDPGQVFKVLEHFRPDLILLDLYMPGVSGIELSRIFRQTPGLETVPIVYLSSEHEVNKQLQALDAGAEDFLLKPIKYRFLYFSLVARIKRARDMQRLLGNDSLTRLPNHTTLYEFLANSMVDMRSKHQTLTLALIGIDRFGAINEHFGPLVGDLVLQTLGSMLERRFRRLGKVGRFSGAVFALTAPMSSTKEIERLLDQLRKDFLDFPIGEREKSKLRFSVTLSAAVVGFPEFETPPKLLQAAERALAQAKSQGGNRVLLLDQLQVHAPIPSLQQLDFSRIPLSQDIAEPMDDLGDLLELDSALLENHEEILDTDSLLEESADSPMDWNSEFPADEISGNELKRSWHVEEVAKVDPFGRGRQILVVDDEFLVVEALAIYLEELGFKVTKALTGDEGFIKAKTSPPDLLLTDLLMFPGIHGFELCKKIRKDPQLSKTKIIVMTAVYRNYRHKMEAKESGADAFIEKPISYDELRKAIEALIGP